LKFLLCSILAANLRHMYWFDFRRCKHETGVL